MIIESNDIYVELQRKCRPGGKWILVLSKFKPSETSPNVKSTALEKRIN